MQSPEYPDLLFVRPRAWGSGRGGYGVQVIVVHYTAGSERSTSAEDGAAYDARRTDGTSTHYFVDSNSVVQCVETWNRANAALYTGNRIGIQYELCGTVQTRAQWLDTASDATITNAARQIARDCKKYGLPVRWLTPAQVRAGGKGICGHADITLAFPADGGDHMDPGTQFPRDVLLARVGQFLTPTPDAPPTATENPQQKEEEDTVVVTYLYCNSKWGLGIVSGGKKMWIESTSQDRGTAYSDATKLSARPVTQAEYDAEKAQFAGMPA